MNERADRGQSSVEFALIIPLVVIVVLAIIQVAVIAYAQLALTHLAREAARAIATDPTVDIGHLIDTYASFDPENVQVQVNISPSAIPGRETVHVSLVRKTTPISRIFAMFLGDLELQAEAKMLIES